MAPCVVLVVYSKRATDGTPPAMYLVVRGDEKLEEVCKFFQTLRLEEVVVWDERTPNNIKVAETDPEFCTGAFSPYYFPCDNDADSVKESAMHYVDLVKTTGTADLWEIMPVFKEQDSPDFFMLEFTINYLGQ